MRPLRCSMRLGFQGTSKWNRSAQWVWRLRPSRAASVAIRMRSGCFFGSALKARLISSRSSVGRRAVVDRDPLARRGRCSAIGGIELLLQVALGVVVLGEDQDARVVPPGCRPGHEHGWPAPSRASWCGTRASGMAASRLRDVASSRRAGVPLARRCRIAAPVAVGRSRDLRTPLGPELLRRRGSRGRRRPRRRRRAGRTGLGWLTAWPASLPGAAARPCRRWTAGCGRTPRSTTAAAAGGRRRAGRPAACVRFDSPLRRCSARLRYWSSSAAELQFRRVGRQAVDVDLRRPGAWESRPGSRGCPP